MTSAGVFRRVCVLALGLIPAAAPLSACSGRSAANGDCSEPLADDGSCPSGGGAGSAGGNGGSAGSGGVSKPNPPAGACKLPDDKLPATRVWRLSRAQYANTMDQLFGVKVDATALPRDPSSLQGASYFDSFSNGLVIDDDLATAYRDTAGKAAAALLPGITKDRACLMNKPADTACVEDFVDTFGSKSFRRPLEGDEKKRFVDLFTASQAKWDGATAASVVLRAMLQSPRFLYRTELGSGSGARVALTHHEVASQLSYLIADGPPDAELLKAAADGKLRDPAVVKQHAQRLLDTAGAKKKVVGFFTQLTQMAGIGSGAILKDTGVFPSFTDDLKRSMETEVATFVEKILWDEQGSLKSLFTSDHSYLNATMATHYGLPTSGLGADFKKTTLPTNRLGLLSLGGVLSAHGRPNATSPASRGLLVYTGLLCQEKPEPPPGAADQAAGKIYGPDAMATQREHYEFAKKAAPACIACHSAFVPFGLGLETFDAIGRYRDSEFDKRLDTAVELKGYGDADGQFKSTLELAGKVIESEAGRRCFAQQFESFGFGRLVDGDAEACELDGLAKRLQSGNLRVQDFILELTQLDSFYNRHGV